MIVKLLPFILGITGEKFEGSARRIETMGSIRRCSKTWRLSILLLFQTLMPARLMTAFLRE
jgi:hypothetical protein